MQPAPPLIRHTASSEVFRKTKTFSATSAEGVKAEVLQVIAVEDVVTT
jgi:hypothetical protein